MNAFSLFLALVGALSSAAYAKGSLATRAQELSDRVLGTDDLGFEVSQKEYRIETGKAYSLKIISSGRQGYAMATPEFSDFISRRKAEAGDMDIKVNSICGLEFVDEAKAETSFVPINPRTYEIRARGVVQSGLVVKYIVE